MKTSPKIALIASLSALLIAGCSSGNGSSSASTSTSTSANPVPAAVASALADRSASGEALANGWYGLLAATGADPGTPEQVSADSALVKPYLDPAFQVQRASGQRYLEGDYVPDDVDTFEISNVVVTEPTDGIKVVRYGASTPGAATPGSSAVFSSEISPRISVFRWDQDRGHWVIVSHANFNTPVAAVCDQTPVKEAEEHPTTSAEDVATGEALVNEWRDITTGKLQKPSVLDPQNQIQLADGEGWPNPDGSTIKWSPAGFYQPEGVVITRDGDVLVATYAAIESGLSVEGKTYGESGSPRMLTYRLNDKNEWNLIALANFNSPKQVPKGVDCAKNAG